MRDRTVPAECRLATLCQMRAGGVWEIAVPNGAYDVAVGIGDGGYPSIYTLNVEGVNYWDRFPLAEGQFASKSERVMVHDGRVRIDAGSASAEATRINYVLIAAAEAPPPPPGALSAVALSPDQVELRWSDESANETEFQLERPRAPSSAARRRFRCQPMLPATPMADALPAPLISTGCAPRTATASLRSRTPSASRPRCRIRTATPSTISWKAARRLS